MSGPTSRLGARGLVLTFIAWAAIITFVAFPYIVMPVLDGAAERQARHG